MEFPPSLDNKTTRDAIHRYQVNTDNAIIYLNHIYDYYSHFTHLSELIIIPTDNPLVTIASTTGIICFDQFNSCGCSFQLYIFCKKCWKGITERKSPKYSISNGISQLYYQNYLLALENLNIAKEAIITRTYPIVTILKLRQNDRFNPRSYRGI